MVTITPTTVRTDMPKEDAEAVHSSGHPGITNNIPRTEKAIGSKKRTAKKPKRGGKRKRGNERLTTVYDITQLIQAKKIRTRLELVSLAVIQNKDGTRPWPSSLQLEVVRQWTKHCHWLKSFLKLGRNFPVHKNLAFKSYEKLSKAIVLPDARVSGVLQR